MSSGLRSHLLRERVENASNGDSMLQSTAPTLGSGNLHDVVRLPAGEDINEWLAVNIMDVFNQVRMLYGTIIDQCTNEVCPQMTAGPAYEYFWTENDRILPCSAPVYIDYVMTWVQDQLDDESIFPSQVGRLFPWDFMEVCEGIMRRLFRVYAHVYSAHAARFNELNATPHLNTSFKQFILFARQFPACPCKRA